MNYDNHLVYPSSSDGNELPDGHSSTSYAYHSQSQQQPIAVDPETTYAYTLAPSQPLTPNTLASALGLNRTTFSEDISFQIPSFLTGPPPLHPHRGEYAIAPLENTDSNSAPSAQTQAQAQTYLPPANMPSSSEASSSRVQVPPAQQPLAPISGEYVSSTYSSLSSAYVHPSNATTSGGGPSSSTHEHHAPSDPGPSAPSARHTIPPAPAGLASSTRLPEMMSMAATFASAAMAGPGLYSTTGFDMLNVLARVALRPNPKIQLGPVDMTTSFCVVDVRQFDQPIVYASPTFSQLTGYEIGEIVGKNCRFLQSPEGQINKGQYRDFTDPTAVQHLCTSTVSTKECQVSLLNYRKGGAPFVNLVTIIPIPWDTDAITYLVGFQVDLVDQPNAIMRTMRDGSYIVNYSNLTVPRPLPAPGPTTVRTPRPASNDKLPFSHGLRTILATEGHDHAVTSTVDDQEKHDLHSLLLKHSDDFIHVLSLKGSFLYVSSSVQKALGFTPDEFVGKMISDFAHPSDIIPVLRELKDSSAQPPSSTGVPYQRSITLFFRIKHKHHGYVWIESVGRLQVDPGKGRKAVILSGRVKEMPSLSWRRVANAGGLGETEFWSHLTSESGLFTVVSSGVFEVLGLEPDQVVGTRIRDHVSEEWREVVDGAISEASMAVDGQPRSVQCAWIAKDRRHVNAVVVLYPSEGSNLYAVRKSGVLVCQVRLVPVRPISTPQRRVAGSPYHYISRHSNSPRGASPQTGTVRGVNVASGRGSTRSPPISQHPGSPRSYQTLNQSRFSTENPSGIVHPLTANVFEELDTMRDTNWQYELQQLRIVNKRLKEEIDAITGEGCGIAGPSIAGPSTGKGVDTGGGAQGGSSSGSSP